MVELWSCDLVVRWVLRYKRFPLRDIHTRSKYNFRRPLQCYQHMYAYPQLFEVFLTVFQVIMVYFLESQCIFPWHRWPRVRLPVHLIPTSTGTIFTRHRTLPHLRQNIGWKQVNRRAQCNLPTRRRILFCFGWLRVNEDAVQTEAASVEGNKW